MEKRTGLALGSLVAGVLIAASAFGQPSMGGMPGHGAMGHHMGGMAGGDDHFMMLLRSANLSSAQHAQVRQILKGERAQMKSVYAGFHAVHEQIAEKLFAPGGLTPADLAPLEQKAVHYQQQIDQNMIETAIAIRNVLTPAQLSRLSQVHQQLQSLHQQIRNLMGSDADEAPADQSN
ncbi:MAG TPA: periplasmic heavy metal sensor [Rhizomicrobium sp.]|nr:periplasmic heavy metal sensor [Rhizomicrobium sp.]